MNNKVKYASFMLGGMLIGSLSVVGANQAIQVFQNMEIKVDLNGQIQEFTDETTGEVQYPITYHDRTYLPLRNVADLAGLDVDYDAENNVAILTDKTTLKGYFSNKKPKYSFILSEKSSEEIWNFGGFDGQYCKLYLYDDNTFYYDDATRWDYLGKYSIVNSVLELDFDVAQGYLEGPNDINPQEIDAKVMLDFSTDKLTVKSATSFKVHKVKEFVGSIIIVDAESMEMGFDCLKPGMVLDRFGKEIIINKDLTIKQIKEIDASYNEVGKKYILTDDGNVYIATFNNLDTNLNKTIQYKKVENIPGKVVDIRFEFNGGLVICTLENGNKVYFTNNGGVFKGIYNYYSFLDGGYPFINRANDMSIYFANDTEVSIYVKQDKVSFRIYGTYQNNDNRLICKFTRCSTEEDKREIEIDGELIIDYHSEDWKFIAVSWKYNPTSEKSSYYDAYFIADFIKPGDEFPGATV